MNRALPSARTALWASACALLFGALHVVWSFAFYYFPSFGRLTLGPSFDGAFGRPAFMRYDLIVAALFVAASALPLATLRPWATAAPRRVLRAGLWTAAVLLGLRGAGGLTQVSLMLFGVIGGSVTRWVVYDVWFLVCGVLLGAVARDLRRPGHVAESSPAMGLATDGWRN